jgi:hypothetical protein
MLQVGPHVSRLPFLPIRVRGIFSYLLAMKWVVSIPMYHQLSNSGLATSVFPDSASVVTFTDIDRTSSISPVFKTPTVRHWFRLLQINLCSAFKPLFESRRSHGARSHGPESLKPLPGLDGS